jgi:hypothetical protein
VERKVKIPMPPDGRLVDGFDVPVVESTERWTEIKLEDGTVLRIKPSVLSAIRVPGQWDADGNPTYALRANNAMLVAEAPDHLKRPSPTEATKKAN